MDILAANEKNSSLRLTLESLRAGSRSSFEEYSPRRSKAFKAYSILRMQVVLITASLGIGLYLSFAFSLPIPLIALVAILLSIKVLQLKLRQVKISKFFRIKEPRLEVGELVATIRSGNYYFYKIRNISHFHIYLEPLDRLQDFFEPSTRPETNTHDCENKKTLFLHKKRVLNSFYKVISWSPAKKESLSA